jgi:hypothetical protein
MLMALGMKAVAVPDTGVGKVSTERSSTESSMGVGAINSPSSSYART